MVVIGNVIWVWVLAGMQDHLLKPLLVVQDANTKVFPSPSHPSTSDSSLALLSYSIKLSSIALICGSDASKVVSDHIRTYSEGYRLLFSTAGRCSISDRRRPQHLRNFLRVP